MLLYILLLYLSYNFNLKNKTNKKNKKTEKYICLYLIYALKQKNANTFQLLTKNKSIILLKENHSTHIAATTDITISSAMMQYPKKQYLHK